MAEKYWIIELLGLEKTTKIKSNMFTTKPCPELPHLYIFIIQVILVLIEFMFFINVIKKCLNIVIYFRKITVI